MDDAMLWKQDTPTALYLLHADTFPLCFLSLILAASATKWLNLSGFAHDNTTAVSPSLSFSSRLGLYAGVIHHKRSR